MCASIKVLRNSLAANRGQQQHIHHHCRGHHHSHSDSRHNARRHDDDPVRAGGIHLRSCGDLNSTSVASLRRLHPPPHGSSGALYSESALWNGRDSGINHCVIRESGLRKLVERWETGLRWGLCLADGVVRSYPCSRDDVFSCSYCNKRLNTTPNVTLQTHCSLCLTNSISFCFFIYCFHSSSAAFSCSLCLHGYGKNAAALTLLLIFTAHFNAVMQIQTYMAVTLSWTNI